MYYVYKMMNTANGKVYIGRTKDFNRRMEEHKKIAYSQKPSNKGKYKRPLYVAIREFGWDSFEITIELECESIEASQLKEMELMEKFNSYNPKFGYNLTRGDIGVRGVTTKTDYTDEEVEYAVLLLKDERLTLEQIEKKTGISVAYLREINRGYRRPIEGETYPIRHIDRQLEEDVLEYILDDLLHSNLTQKEIAKKYGVARSTVTMINIGKNNYREELNYPIRKQRVKKK